MDFSALTHEEKLALVEEARLTWSDEIAELLAQDLGLAPKPTISAPSDTRH